jgi:KTSC domain-containing protein
MLVVVAVESSTIASVGYDLTQGLLQLEFCSGAVYHYFGVPAGVHEALLEAPSKGSYFNRAIRGRFPYRQLFPAVASGALDRRISASACR